MLPAAVQWCRERSRHRAVQQPPICIIHPNPNPKPSRTDNRRGEAGRERGRGWASNSGRWASGVGDNAIAWSMALALGRVARVPRTDRTTAITLCYYYASLRTRTWQTSETRGIEFWEGEGSSASHCRQHGKPPPLHRCRRPPARPPASPRNLNHFGSGGDACMAAAPREKGVEGRNGHGTLIPNAPTSTAAAGRTREGGDPRVALAPFLSKHL